MASTISAGTTSGTAIAIAGDTTGNLAFTTQAGTYTITVPNNTGTVVTTGSSAVVTQAMLSTNVSGNGPAFSAYATSNQSIPATTNTKLVFDTEEYDTNSNFASNRFTPTVAGYYLMTATCRGNAGNNELNLGIWKNGGSTAKQGAILAAGSTATTTNAMFYMNGSTDYLEAYLYCASACTTSGNQSSTYFQGVLIRTA